MVANNQYAYSTPNSRQFACRDLVDKAIGYGVQGHTVDATDLGQCLQVVGNAIQSARAGNGPQLIVASLLRLAGHGEHDPAEYVDPNLRASPLGRDCLRVAEETLIAQGLANASTIELWKVDVQQQVDEAVATTLREPAPDPDSEDWAALSTRRLLEGGEYV